MAQPDKSAFQTMETAPRASAADPAVLGLTGLAVAALVLASASWCSASSSGPARL